MAIETLPILTPRLSLRAYGPADRELFIELVCDPQVNRYVGDGPLDASAAASLFEGVFPVYREQRFAVWAVQTREPLEYVGHAELKPRAGEPGLELVYLLRAAAWGRGLGTELARALRDHALGPLGCSRALATIHPDHEVSRRILQRIGFRFARQWLEAGDDVPTCLWVCGDGAAELSGQA